MKSTNLIKLGLSNNMQLASRDTGCIELVYSTHLCGTSDGMMHAYRCVLCVVLCVGLCGCRQSKKLTQSTLVYGEIAFESFGIAFEKIKKRYGGLAAGGHFYDLGSGTGKPVRAHLILSLVSLVLDTE